MSLERSQAGHGGGGPVVFVPTMCYSELYASEQVFFLRFRSPLCFSGFQMYCYEMELY